MFSGFIAATADFPEALPPHCEPTSEFLRNVSIWFGACFPSNLSLASNAFGCLSIIAWLFAQLPQIVKNHRQKSVDGLSPTFLGNWLLGDICNLTGAVMTNQMWFQQVIGIYYVLVDVVLCMQYVWYSQFKPECMRRKGLGGSDTVLDDDLEVVDGISVCDSCSTCSRSRHNSYSGSKKERRASSMNLPSGRSVLAAMTLGSKLADALPIGGEVVNATSFELDKQIIGNTIAWISAFMQVPYLFYRTCRRSL
jgi:solute carrier family 66 (lysosomal lysine-arginine transporter), member 1